MEERRGGRKAIVDEFDGGAGGEKEDKKVMIE